jgi:hypothetical protein
VTLSKQPILLRLFLHRPNPRHPDPIRERISIFAVAVARGVASALLVALVSALVVALASEIGPGFSPDIKCNKNLGL